jgi:hypothetical protein
LDAAGTLILGPGPFVEAGTGAVYSGYVDIAGVLGADALDIPIDVWESMDQAQRIAAVEGNITNALASGQQIVFTVGPAEATGWTLYEYNFLEGLGYQVAQQGTSWVVVP